MITPDDLSDLEILALTIYGEARGEAIEGQIAVGNVINNRAQNGKSFKEVCLSPKQFSCWNESDPNYPVLLELGDQLIQGQDIDNPYFNQCLFIATGIRDSMVMDNTNHAVNYLTDELYKSDKAPKWAKSMEVTAQIGNHVFGIA